MKLRRVTECPLMTNLQSTTLSWRRDTSRRRSCFLSWDHYYRLYRCRHIWRCPVMLNDIDTSLVLTLSSPTLVDLSVDPHNVAQERTYG